MEFSISDVKVISVTVENLYIFRKGNSITMVFASFLVRTWFKKRVICSLFQKLIDIGK